MSRDDEETDLPAIDAQALESVTGGTSSNDDVTAAIQGLSQDIKSLVDNQKKGSSDLFTQLLPFLLMMGGGGSWSFNSNGGFSCSGGNGGFVCQCGMRPCRCRRR